MCMRMRLVAVGWLVFSILGCCGGILWAETRSEFLFRLQSALKMRDFKGLVSCFHFEGVEGETEKQVWRALEQILAWEGAQVRTTERVKRGPFFMMKEGRRYTLNGDWIFQVHIQQVESPGRAFVFPCGVTADERQAILLSVPAR